MVTIQEYEPSEIDEITNILAPAFEDKVMAVIGDREKALKIIPTVITNIEGNIFVAIDEEEEFEEEGSVEEGSVRGEDGKKQGKMVGAIIISTDEFRITLSIVLACLRILGPRGSWRVYRMVSQYLKTEPDKLEKEGRLEAVGVLDDHRGKGIGKLLVMRGEEYLREIGMNHFGLGVKADNPAHTLYLELGFEDVEKYHNSLDEWIYMRKKLD